MGVHTHSLAFICTPWVLKGCSILTYWHSCALNGRSGAAPTHSLAFICTKWVLGGCSILTYWHSCALNWRSGAAPTHSLAFICTKWVFRSCSHSLIGIHAHSQVFRKCSTHVLPVHVPEGPMNMFSNLQSTQRPCKIALHFHWITFLWLRQAG